MKAVVVHELTGPDGVIVADVPEPDAGDNVLVEVRAAGISYPDVMMSRGTYQYKAPLPFTLGIEAAGVVRAAPDGCGLRPGDRVACFGPGACAEQMVAPVATTFPLPAALDFPQGAALIMNYHTAHFALARRAGLRAGETVLVLGAAGGVGTAALQVARGLGARTIAAVSSEAKEKAAYAAGADEVVRTDADWSVALTALTNGAGVDVIVDPVGGSDDQLREHLRCLAVEGRLVVIGFASGAIPTIGLNRLLFRNVSVVGAAWGAFALARPEYLREVAVDLDRMVGAGQVRPLVGTSYPMAGVADALRDIEQRRAVGKLVMEGRS